MADFFGELGANIQRAITDPFSPEPGGVTFAEQGFFTQQAIGEGIGSAGASLQKLIIGEQNFERLQQVLKAGSFLSSKTRILGYEVPNWLLGASVLAGAVILLRR